jgi:hypothetical protein
MIDDISVSWPVDLMTASRCRRRRSRWLLLSQALFASSTLSPSCGALAVGASQGIYVLKYRAGVGTMGLLHFFHGVLAVVFSLHIGFLQDKECCVFRCFNKERWGRRAPWILLHCPLMSLTMYCAWAPPSLAPDFLAAW